uniref:Cell cycle associated protein 1a n=1 Tax=Cyclopterus lumpus TaxID=8103 RepID=A0A8C2XIA2_CYCLU
MQGCDFSFHLSLFNILCFSIFFQSKLDDCQTRKSNGEQLNQDQLDSLTKYQEIANNLDFARELQKSFLALGQEIQKAVKKTARREQLQREEIDQQRLKTVLELQFLLDQLGDENVRQDLKRPDATGSPLLTDTDLTSLDELYKLVGPDRNFDVRYEASVHLLELFEGRDKAVAGTTYKSLKDTLDKVLLSGYFDRAQTHQNGTCVEEEEQEEQTVMVNSLQHQPPAQLATEPAVTVNHGTPPPAADPVVRKQVVHDLMAQMQGTYNFMQDSMLDFDGQALDPAIVSAQPMKPVQTLDLQQMGCPSNHSESRLPQTSALSGPQESSQVSRVEAQQAVLMSLSSDQSPTPCSLSSAFPPVSKSTHTGGINVNAAPFQSVQAVFNLNAPVPPATDGQADPLKQPSQFPGGYGQGFSSQSESTVDQPDVPQETLQSVVAGFQPQDHVLPSAGGHEESSPGAGFGQSGQSFYNSRAVPRGGPRNGRGMMNGYRGSSNGFRGGYEGYRPPFSNAPSGGYGQTQFNTSRDYSNNTYQREGYQQNYKRGPAQGPRSLSRGNAQAMRS